MSSGGRRLLPIDAGGSGTARHAVRRHVQRPSLDGAELLKGHMAVVLAKKVQEPLVVGRRHVEQLCQHAVVAAGLFESLSHQ